jgi:hypothetical protein
MNILSILIILIILLYFLNNINIINNYLRSYPRSAYAEHSYIKKALHNASKNKYLINRSKYKLK